MAITAAIASGMMFYIQTGSLTFLLMLWSVLRAAWLDIFALIIFTLSRSPRCIMCYVMLGIALQYHYGHPGDRDYSKNFPPAQKKIREQKSEQILEAGNDLG